MIKESKKKQKDKECIPKRLTPWAHCWAVTEELYKHNSNDHSEGWEAGIWSTDSCLMAEDFLLGNEIPSASGFHLCVLAQTLIDVEERSQMEKQRAAGTCRRKLSDTRNCPRQLLVNSHVC